MQSEKFWTRPIVIALLSIGVLMITGCNGCSDDPAVAQKKEEKEEREKRKPDFEHRVPVLLPAVFPKIEKEPPIDPEEEAKKTIKERAKDELERQRKREQAIMAIKRRNRTKLGHWATSYIEIVANNFNSSGELITSSVDSLSKPVPVYSTDHYMATTRPASLAKGEWKSLEASIYVPRRKTKSINADVEINLRNSATGLSMLNLQANTTLMKPFQFHFILLSNRSQSYNYIEALDSIVLKEVTNDGSPFPPMYYVVPTRDGDPVPLPRQALEWTTIAYVLWDDFGPDQLDENQKTAMLDWLHQGGQLIVSGPDALTQLRDSFLQDYLPAQVDSTFNLTSDDLVELNENWTVPVTRNNADKKILQLAENAPLAALKFKEHTDSNYVNGTGELVIERRVGRGRIVATAFSLDDKQIRRWRSFPSFFNGCLLRKPGRKFDENQTSSLTYYWPTDATSIFDPLMGSTVRYLSRDLQRTGTPSRHAFTIQEEPEDPYGWRGMYMNSASQTLEDEFLPDVRASSSISRNKDNIWRYGGFADDMQSGVGGWSDESAVSIAARETLKQAAGISPPSASFVLKMLAAYLLVLVPLNWLVFRLMGRVEWAWIAAPIIAIAGAFSVVKMASLDIGFVRSNTQIGILELHGDYGRGHMTEYSALYTSLSTRYDVELDNQTAQTLPFASKIGPRFKPAEKISQVTLDRSRENKLKGFQVKSNTTGMLHSEYMTDVNGTVSLALDENDKERISNTTRIDIDGAGLVRRDEQGDYFVSHLGLVASGAGTEPIEWQETTLEELPGSWIENNNAYLSDVRILRKTWLENFDDLNTEVSIEDVRSVQEWSPYMLQLEKRLGSRARLNGFDSSEYQMTTFAEVSEQMLLLQESTGINVGLMFDTIVENLELEPGETRMIGFSDKAIGATKFLPESTQTVRKTLIVVNLRKGKLPPAERDANSISDVTTFSNLDQEEEEEDKQLQF